MAAEIERKFLVTGDAWQRGATRCSVIRQAYLAGTDGATVRVRIKDDQEATLTVKSANSGSNRREFEYPIPLEDARELMQMRTGAVIEKRRHEIPAEGLCWEVDAFEGAHQGLVLAEVELAGEDAAFDRPTWLGREVTGDPRYYNARLAADGRATVPSSPSSTSG